MEMRGYVQSVVIQGIVYIGSGHVGGGTINKHIIMRYDAHTKEWSRLPAPYRACDFAMATVNNTLVLVGGEERDRKSKKLGVWGMDTNEWTHPYPEMPTARSDSSAVAYKEWLVVAGGISSDFGVALSCIEVFNVDNKQWYSGPPMPTSWAYMRSVAVGDMCYFIGGSTGKIGPLSGIITEKAYSVSLPALIGQLNSRNSRDRDRQIRKEMWKKIHGLQMGCSTPLSIDGSLLVAGGRKDKEAVTAIHHYQPDTGLWVRVGDLPTPRYDCVCTMMTDKEMLVTGGYNHGMVKKTDIALVNYNAYNA
jgi:N-acetylneuraminic acid mutarotase